MTVIQLRCDANPSRLLAKVRQAGGRPEYVENGTLIELVCKDCRQGVEESGQGRPARVLHRFNVAGELVETEVVW